MLPKINPTTTKAWQQLLKHAEDMKEVHMKDLFSKDPGRFKKYSLCISDIAFDYSKNILTDTTVKFLLQLAAECKLNEGIQSVLSGDPVNETENRAVLHTALRNFCDEPAFAGGKDVMPAVKKVRKKMEKFCEAVHSGEMRGYTGKKIKYIVNIGIRGSDLAPLMVTEALRH
jgi:glucose-6-phosphate isomerase